MNVHGQDGFTFTAANTAGASAAAVSVFLDNDDQLRAILPEQNIVVVAEGRIGNDALNGDFELDLGQSTGAPAEIAQYDWGNGETVSFTFSVSAGGAAWFEVVNEDEEAVRLPVAGAFNASGEFDTIFVRTFASKADSSVVVDNLTLDGQGVGSSSAHGAGGLGILWIQDRDEIANGFTLTGNATLTWDEANMPLRSHLAFQIKVGDAVDIDIDVDSNNDGGIDADNAGTDDPIEDDENLPGEYIAANIADKDNDGVFDWADGFNANGIAGDGDDANAAEQFTPVKLTLDQEIDLATALVSISYANPSDPAAVTWDGTQYTRPGGNIRLWKAWAGDTRDKRAIDAEDPADQGDFIPPGDYFWSELGGAADDHSLTLYLEGIAPSGSLGAERIKVNLNGGPVEDAARVSVIHLDLDIDSDNTDSLDRSPEEAQVEDHDSHPGRLLRANKGSDQDADGILDFLDGYDFDATIDEDNFALNIFEPLVLEVPEPVDLSEAKIKLSFAEAPLVAAPGGVLRIWTTNGIGLRNKNPIDHATTPGDYVPPGEYTTAELEFTGRTTTLYVEAVNSGTDRIVAELDPDGDAGPADYMILDAVRVTSIYLDLDVDDDGSLGSANDGALNYLPGYVGTNAVLSQGNTFNTVQYQGQQVRVIAESAGTNQHIDEVNFRIIATTDYDGYAENVSDPSLEVATNKDDFSFQLSQDDQLAHVTTAAPTPDDPGTILGDLSYVHLQAKDYGGKAVVQAEFKKNGTTLATWDLPIPLDHDDGISDAWERKLVTAWNTQYGVSETVDVNFFNAADDKELADPDGTANGSMVAHKTPKDTLNVLQEYRGYVLDGGNDGQTTHNGGHLRLSPAKKELLVEVDQMRNVVHMPSAVALRNVLDASASGFSDQADGAGIAMYWAIDQDDATPHVHFASEQERGNWATANRNNDLGQFVHLIFADKMTDFAGVGGVSNLYGSFIFVTTVWDTSFQQGWSFSPLLAMTTAHELTHLLLDSISANGFDNGEHLDDPDPSDPAKGFNDFRYLMYVDANVIQAGTIAFSDKTRKQLDLTSKESVERV